MRSVSRLLAVLLVGAFAWQTGSTTTVAQADQVLVFFVASDGIHGQELWTSDGTEPGTVMVKDIRPGERGSRPSLFAVIDGEAFLAANDGQHGNRMWVSDGTADGTRLVERSPSPLQEYWAGSGATVVRGKLFFSSQRRYRVWITDGTDLGTEPLGIEGQCISSAGATVFFVHNRTSEVWRTDGTRQGTFLLQRLRRPSALSACPGFTDADGTMIYEGRDVKHGNEPWKSNGRRSGTKMVKDIEPGSDSSYPTMLGSVGNRAYFETASGSLWASDGMRENTVRLRRFRYLGPLGGTPYLDDVFFFYAAAEGVGAELWKSDGTSGGTALVKDINPRAGSNPLGSAVLNDTLFFSADDGVHGFELWRTDGTETGTAQVKDIWPGDASAFPDHLVSSGGLLFFGANDGVHGFELWKSDGTDAGTVMVKDINPGTPQGNLSLTYICASPSSEACPQLR